MSTHLPIACTLNSAELAKRVAAMREVGAASFVSAEVGSSRATLRFRPDAQTATTLRSIVAAEAECCAFLTLELTEGPDASTLAIHAPEGAEEVVRDLVAAFRGEAEGAAKAPTAEDPSMAAADGPAAQASASTGIESGRRESNPY